ncbi:hypothetical protein K0W35_004682 [Vibrio parahaemolyticus]|nr:hypothetical protein [Vibrio parahaemolyticus]
MKGNPKHLFSISSGDKVISERYNNNVMDDLYRHLTNITKINMTTYRAGRAIAELIIHLPSAQNSAEVLTYVSWFNGNESPTT